MRHIKQMTRKELNEMIEHVKQDMYKSHDNDTVLWYELSALKSRLEDEAHSRAKDIGTAHTASSIYAIVM